MIRRSPHKRKLHRRPGIRWEYNRDGMADRESIRGTMRRYWRRWWLRVTERDARRAVA